MKIWQLKYPYLDFDSFFCRYNDDDDQVLRIEFKRDGKTVDFKVLHSERFNENAIIKHQKFDIDTLEYICAAVGVDLDFVLNNI